jgi:hypothetical protein
MKTADVQALIRGKRVASQLGWPRQYQGLFGATSGLLEPFASFKMPHSSMSLARRYALASHLATVRKVNESAARLAEVSRR